MSTRDALRLQLASGLAGVLGGLGGVAYQWVLRHPSSHAIVIAIVQIAAYVLFALGGLTTLGVMAKELRTERRFVSMSLYIGVAFIVALYAFGGRWPFWRP
jgi:hypothetical protein